MLIARLKDSGLDSIPGGGRRSWTTRCGSGISPKKIGWEQWAAVMREAHRQGLRSTATMMFGSVETPEAIIAHLLRVRALQEETGASRRSSPGCSSREHRAVARPAVRGGVGPGIRPCRWVPAVLALSRVLLPNVPTVQVSW